MGPFILEQEAAWSNGDALPNSYLDRLGAHISGGKALLHRFGKTSEEALLGAYDSSVDTVYSYTDKTDGSLIDTSYTKIYMKDAEIRILQDIAGVGGTVAPVSGYSNRLRSSTLAFKTNTSAYPRNSTFGGRDVAIGDKVKYGATISSTRYEINTYVAGFVAEVVAASIGTATAGTGNQATQTVSASFSQTAGAANYVEGTGSAASYDDLDGGADRTYTIIFTTGGEAADARFNVISSDGLDNATNVTPSAFTVATAIGSKGATVTWTLDSGNPVDSGAPTNLFVAGQTFQLVVEQAFTQPTIASGGTFTGTATKTFTATVTTGGLFSSTTAPKISVSTSLGTGYIAPFVVASSGAAVSLGDGVTLTFTGTGLCKDDKYYIVATAASEGALQTLILKDNMSTTLLTASDGDLELYIPVTSLEITEERTESPPDVNWSATSSTVTLEAGITATAPDGSLVDADGDTMYKPVTTGSAYVHYREWDQEDLGTVSSIDDEDDVEASLGLAIPDNPLSYGVLQALKNSNGRPVFYTPVGDPDDVDSWGEMLTAIEYAQGPYKLAPMTHDEDVFVLFKNHCEDQSEDEKQSWRSAIVAMDVLTTKAIVTSATTSNGSNALFTISDNPAVTGNQYTRVQCTTANAKFLTNDVEAGDLFRYLFVSDGFGNVTYTEYVVASVVNEDELLLESGPSVPFAVAQLGEVHRTLSRTEIVEDLEDRKEAFTSSRVNIVLPDELEDTVEDEVTTVASYFAAAALAGAISAVPPHQPYHYTQISGFSAVPKSSTYFAQAQLRQLSESGFIVLDKDADGIVYVRKMVTSDVDTVDTREEVYIRNLDGIYFVLLEKLNKFRGHANNVEAVRDKLLFEAQMAIEAIKFESKTALLGGMIVSGTASAARQHLTLVDNAVIDLTLVRPYPLNETQFQLVI